MGETKGTLYIVALDVQNEKTIVDAASVVKHILGDDGRLDYLVNNAALVCTVRLGKYMYTKTTIIGVARRYSTHFES